MITFDSHDDNDYSGIESDFTTIIRTKQYTIKIIHAYVGVGVTDKYKHVTYLSVFDGHDCINLLLKNKLDLSFDYGLIRADFDTLLKIMEYLHA